MSTIKQMCPVLAAVVLTGLALLLPARSVEAQCGGLCLYEVGTPDMGRSYAGAGAVAQNASTAYTNPAGMTLLDENQVLTGSFGAYFDLSLDLDAGTTTPPLDATRDGGGHSGAFVPGLSAYAVMGIREDLKFGFTINALFGGGIDYDGGWTGRGFVTENQLTGFNIEPSLGYRVNDWLSVGTGLHIIYTTFQQELKIVGGPIEPIVKFNDLDDWGVTFTLAALLEPLETTRIGVVYRYKMDVNLDGDLELPVNAADPDFGFDFNYPQGINVSVRHQLTPEWALLFDTGWTDWSDFGDQSLSAGASSVNFDRDWKDTWRIGTGFQYAFAEGFLLSGGFSYDSSPVRDSKRLPDIPVFEAYRFSTGIQHEFNEHVEVGFSYTLIWFGPAEVDHVALPPGNTVVLDGHYNHAVAHFLGLNLIARF